MIGSLKAPANGACNHNVQKYRLLLWNIKRQLHDKIVTQLGTNMKVIIVINRNNLFENINKTQKSGEKKNARKAESWRNWKEYQAWQCCKF